MKEVRRVIREAYAEGMDEYLNIEEHPEGLELEDFLYQDPNQR